MGLVLVTAVPLPVKLFLAKFLYKFGLYENTGKKTESGLKRCKLKQYLILFKCYKRVEGWMSVAGGDKEKKERRGKEDFCRGYERHQMYQRKGVVWGNRVIGCKDSSNQTHT